MTTPQEIIETAVRILMILSILIGVVRVIEGGYYIMMSQGDDQELTKGKETLTSAVIGIIFAVAGVAFINTILKALITTG